MLQLVEVDALQRLLQGTQCTDFVDGTEWATARQCQRNSG